MNKLLLAIVFTLLLTNSFAQTYDFEVETIKNTGDNDKRINLVILGDGYTAGEMELFRSDAIHFSDTFFSQSPYTEYTNYFNVHIVKVISNESGASHPGTANDENTVSVPVSDIDNYFGSSYDSYGVHRLLFSSNYPLITNVLAANFPEYDQALVLVNSPYYGGSGGTFPFASTGENGIEIAIHEIGHSLVNLKDEYYPGDAFVEEAINMTQETDPTQVRWTNWYGSNNVGIYSHGSSGIPATWFRPHQNCKMRFLNAPFCPVCSEGTIERIHDLVSPIDAYTPNNLSLAPSTYPISFNLTLVSPTTNSLESTWTLNGSEFSTALDMISVAETDLNEGINTLTVAVTDNSSLVRVNQHETVHVNTVTWSIDNSTLGISDIASEVNKFTISLYPNPSNNQFYVKYDSPDFNKLRLVLTSMDGKNILNKSLDQGVTNSIDISQQATGIYMVHIYNGNVRLATKKVIKQ
ncbi:M64 family metallopeptidase [Bizionia sp. KMM 8389]